MFYNLSAGEYEKALIHNKVDENSIVESTCEELMSWEKKSFYPEFHDCL